MTQSGNFLNEPFDDEEKKLMEAVEDGKSIAVSGKEVANIKNLLRSTSSKVISLRVNEFDLSILKERAEAAGLPYQTLINSVLHRYATGDIVLKSVV